MRERRYKIFKIRQQDLMDVLLDPTRGKVSRLVLKELIGIPYDIPRIVSNSLQDCWDVVVYSETFEIVPDCQHPPELVAETQVIDLLSPSHLLAGSPISWDDSPGRTITDCSFKSGNVNTKLDSGVTWTISNNNFIPSIEAIDPKDQSSSGNNPFDKDWR